MFRIEDGRKEFYQWDLDRKIIVSDPTVTEVHFCNKTDNCSLVVEVYEEDGLRVANVPNILLQENWDIRVYGYCGNCYTKQYERFKVIARTRPADYVYTETEVKRWEEIEQRCNDVLEIAESISQGGILPLVANNYEELVAAFNETPKENYVIGQNIYVVTVNVPDLWVMEITEEAVAYTYTTDEAFVNEIGENGYVQVGYYKLAQLETKGNLQDYVKNTDWAKAGWEKKGGVISFYTNPNVSGIQRYTEGTIVFPFVKSADETTLSSRAKSDNTSLVPKHINTIVKGALTGDKRIGQGTAGTDAWAVAAFTEEEKAQALEVLGVTDKLDEKLNKPTDWVGYGFMRYNPDVGIEKVGYYQGVPGAGQIPLSKTRGRIVTNTPEEDLDCVNLDYFNSNKGTKLYQHVISWNGPGYYSPVIVTTLTDTPFTVNANNHIELPTYGDGSNTDRIKNIIACNCVNIAYDTDIRIKIGLVNGDDYLTLLGYTSYGSFVDTVTEL